MSSIAQRLTGATILHGGCDTVIWRSERTANGAQRAFCNTQAVWPAKREEECPVGVSTKEASAGTNVET